MITDEGSMYLYVHHMDNKKEFKDNAPAKFTVIVPSSLKSQMVLRGKWEVSLVEVFSKWNGFHSDKDMYFILCDQCEPIPTPRNGNQRLLRAIPLNKSYWFSEPVYRQMKSGFNSMELTVVTTTLQPVNTLHDLTLLLHILQVQSIDE